jgi:hypothetical protein
MSPEKSGYFLALERGDFSRNYGILQLVKMGPFDGYPYPLKIQRFSLTGRWIIWYR